MVEISLTGDQMLTVLETVAHEGPLSAAEVARICDINRTVAHRLLTTLAERSYVRKGEAGYTVGPAALRLAQSADADIRKIAKPLMVRLAERIGETVVMHAVDDLEAVVVDQALGQRHLVRVEHSPGSRHPLTQGASGWSLVAFQNERLIARVLKKAADPEAVRKRIEQVRTDGYAISHDELQLGVHGVAVPIVEADGLCQISLAILVPSIRSASVSSLLDPLRVTAKQITDSFGR
ncbi:IclR family transcriptional regulator [Rhizobium sp. KVB221]|uniref:IclR family transcriptional regulator n=1 Tax=Rhizobium setariae TaxID=2801340 RepID=A0A936YRC1_9HYPH|nr:IclR family transcriptional regulator [Rhizobium setariae]MBL0374238.1 IclR family transcriptional regulator [Rhizobium setariae]